MYIVLPRRPERTHEQLLGDAVGAVLAAREAFGETGAWHAWEPRPRKVCVRGRPAEVDRVRELPHVCAGEALCLPPRRRSEREPELLKLQAHSGGPLEAGDPSPPNPDHALFLLRSDLGMTFGKAVAQIGHAALALPEAGPAGALGVRLAEETTFARVDDELGAACVRDAGLTEVAPGTITALALPPRELPDWLLRSVHAVA
jgi:hypothetical protein